jgi:hypothetical protein
MEAPLLPRQLAVAQQIAQQDAANRNNAPITRPPISANPPATTAPPGVDPNSPFPPQYQGGREQEFISALQRRLASGSKEGKAATEAKLKAIEEYQAKNADIERAARTKEGEGQVETLKKLASDGTEAQGHIAQIEQIRRLGRSVGYGVIPKAQSLLGRFGIPTKGLDDIQAYESAINYMAPQLRPVGSGRLLTNELTSFKNALGGLLTTPQGREIMANNLELLAKYKLDVARIANGTGPAASRMDSILNFNPPHLQVAVGPKRGFVDPQTRHTFIGKDGGDPNDPANWK